MTDSTTVERKRLYSDEELRNLKSWSEVVALSGKPIVNVAETELSTGFSVVTDKNSLVGVPFILLDWTFSMGDMGEFVSANIITRDDRKLILNDGSTGICAQLHRLTPGAPIGVARGLRKSEYARKDENGEVILNPKTGQPERATTFYLDTSAE